MWQRYVVTDTVKKQAHEVLGRIVFLIEISHVRVGRLMRV
jgi:hypothetical protein